MSFTKEQLQFFYMLYVNNTSHCPENFAANLWFGYNPHYLFKNFLNQNQMSSNFLFRKTILSRKKHVTPQKHSCLNNRTLTANDGIKLLEHIKPLLVLFVRRNTDFNSDFINVADCWVKLVDWFTWDFCMRHGPRKSKAYEQSFYQFWIYKKIYLLDLSKCGLK